MQCCAQHFPWILSNSLVNLLFQTRNDSTHILGWEILDDKLDYTSNDELLSRLLGRLIRLQKSTNPFKPRMAAQSLQIAQHLDCNPNFLFPPGSYYRLTRLYPSLVRYSVHIRSRTNSRRKFLNHNS